MTYDSVLTLIMCIYPAIIVIHVIMAYRAEKERALHVFTFVGLLLIFIGLVQRQVFHNAHQSTLLMFAGCIQMLEAAIWTLARSFTQRRWIQRRHA